jgi:signal transduction histidine kinase
MIASLAAKLFFLSSLSKSQMSVFQKMAENLFQEKRANDTRRAFMRYIFHEVRVPLNTITMGLSVLKDDLDSHLSLHAGEAINMMTGATDFMSDTLNDVLSIHKIEEGAMELAMQPFKITEIISRAIVALKRQCLERDIQIFIESTDGASIWSLPALYGDRFRLENVLINFLSNAIKFSPPGSPVTVSVSSSASSMEVVEEIDLGNDRHGNSSNSNSRGGSCNAVTLGPEQSSSTTSASASSPAVQSNLPSDQGIRVSSRDRSNSNISRDNPGAGATERSSQHQQPQSQQQPQRVIRRRSSSGFNGIYTAANGVATPLSSTPRQKLTRKVIKKFRNVILLVRDQGIGISTEEIPRLFVPFSEISLDTLRESQGTGFGLILAKEFVGMHGGIVLCSSKLGEGSRFGFRIPFEVVDVEDNNDYKENANNSRNINSIGSGVDNNHRQQGRNSISNSSSQTTPFSVDDNTPTNNIDGSSSNRRSGNLISAAIQALSRKMNSSSSSSSSSRCGDNYENSLILDEDTTEKQDHSAHHDDDSLPSKAFGSRDHATAEAEAKNHAGTQTPASTNANPSEKTRRGWYGRNEVVKEEVPVVTTWTAAEFLTINTERTHSNTHAHTSASVSGKNSTLSSLFNTNNELTIQEVPPEPFHDVGDRDIRALLVDGEFVELVSNM